MKAVDQPRAMHLAELAFDLAGRVLVAGGGFVVKVFHGEGFEPFVRDVRAGFESVRVRKPRASRPRSPEVYVVACGASRIIHSIPGRIGTMNGMAKNLILWVIIALVLMSVFNSFGPRRSAAQKMDYSEFVTDVRKGLVQKVIIEGREIEGRTHAGETFSTYSPETDNRSLVGELLDAGVVIDARPPEQQGLLMQIFISWFPMLLLVGVWIFFMRQMQGGGGGRGGPLVRQEPRAPHRRGPGQGDVLRRGGRRGGQGRGPGAGRLPARPGEVPEARRQDPARRADGGLARYRQDAARQGHRGRGEGAVLHDFRAPTSSRCSSGSAPRAVRDMFDQAKKHAPCIIFIDEIDAVGPPSGSRSRWRSRRARADPQSAPGRDGRVRRKRRGHRHCRDQPPGRARPRVAAAGTVRPPGRGAAPRHPRTRADPAGAHAKDSRSTPT